MAIYEVLAMTRYIYGDGSTTSYTIDLGEDLEASTSSRKSLQIVLSVSQYNQTDSTTPPTISSTSISGQFLTVNWASAPHLNVQYSLSISVGV